MKENCEVIRDLLPLVQDGVASEASCRMVQEHLEECEACRTFCISEPVKMPDETLDRRLVASVRKAFFFVGMALLLTGAAVGVALTDSMGMFYNFILMPGVGMLGYWLFRGKSFFCSVGHFSAELSVPDPRNGLLWPLCLCRCCIRCFADWAWESVFCWITILRRRGRNEKEKTLDPDFGCCSGFWFVMDCRLDDPFFHGGSDFRRDVPTAAKDYIQQSNLRTMGFD